MKIQDICFNSLLITITAMVSVNPVYSESSESSKVSFSCQSQEGIPTTLVKTEDGRTQPIFYWKNEAFPTESNTQQLCDRVSQQLDNNLLSDSDLLSMGFKGTKLDNLTVICATDKDNECNLVLFTLSPIESPVETASFVLASILAPQLQENSSVFNIKETSRQSTTKSTGGNY